MKRAIEALLRRKRLFLIPFLIVFVLPVIYSAIFMRSYEASAVVWLDSDTNITTVLQSDLAVSASEFPIQEQADTLSQLLQSRTFVESVIATTSLSAEMTTAREKEKTIEFVRERLAAGAVGANALNITFYGRSAAEAVEVASATTDVFLQWVRQAVEDENAKSLAFFTDENLYYQTELETARTTLENFRKQYRTETTQLDLAEKELTTTTSDVDPAIKTEYDRLKSQETYAEAMYQSSLTDLANARSLAAAEEGRLITGLRVIDEPVEPASFSLKRLLLVDFLALMSAIIVGVVAVVIAELTDETFRTEADVEDVLSLPVLAEVGDREPVRNGVRR